MLEAMRYDHLDCYLLLHLAWGKKRVGSCLFKGAQQKPGTKSCACRDVSRSPEQLDVRL